MLIMLICAALFVCEGCQALKDRMNYDNATPSNAEAWTF